jgi:multiple sugar transport system permease protein
MKVSDFRSKLSDIAHHKKTMSWVVAPFRYFFLIAIGYIVLFQLFYMISYAFRPASEMMDPSVVWIPRNPTFSRFVEAFESLDYFKTLWNTLSIQVISGIAEVATCAVVAYGFARYNFPFKNVLFALVLVTIMVPPVMISVPMYLNYAYFDVFGILGAISKAVGTELRPNLVDSGWVFWLPSLFASGLRSGLFIFIYRQFFKGLPYELEEAASIDGAGPVKTFLNIIVPSSGVAILTVAIFSVVWHWNEHDLSRLYFNNNFPLSVRLSVITTNTASGGISDRGFTMAASLLFVLPVLIMYMILQRKFIQSIDRVGIVG